MPPVLFQFFGSLYASITELTDEKWLEMRGFRDLEGHATKVLTRT